jgi:hypothetical protein
MRRRGREENVQHVLSIGLRWCEILRGIHTANYSRSQLADMLTRLRRVLCGVFDSFLMQMATDASHLLSDKDGGVCGVRRRCTFEECADCIDKFTCLTEEVRTIVHCRVCGVRWFYSVNPEEKANKNGDRFPSGDSFGLKTVGNRDGHGCRAAVYGETCPLCGFIDEESMYQMPRWIEIETAEANKVSPNGESIKIKTDGTFQVEVSAPLYRVDYSIHVVNPSDLVRLMYRAKSSGVMTIGDFVNLLHPQLDILRGLGYGWQSGYERWEVPPSPILNQLSGMRLDTLNINKEMTHLSHRWNVPPPTLADALSIRDRDDPSRMAYQAVMDMDQQLWTPLMFQHDVLGIGKDDDDDADARRYWAMGMANMVKVT